ncbi:hypothetical protein BD779DRAFT_563927 [Infundibulicybe gibba]|nr:hypothetical protein BD779DRAFT_563927 [Infundibulicybe gibba]
MHGPLWIPAPTRARRHVLELTIPHLTQAFANATSSPNLKFYHAPRHASSVKHQYQMQILDLTPRPNLQRLDPFYHIRAWEPTPILSEKPRTRNKDDTQLWMCSHRYRLWHAVVPGSPTPPKHAAGYDSKFPRVMHCRPACWEDRGRVQSTTMMLALI